MVAVLEDLFEKLAERCLNWVLRVLLVELLDVVWSAQATQVEGKLALAEDLIQGESAVAAAIAAKRFESYDFAEIVVPEVELFSHFVELRQPGLLLATSY